MGNRKITLKKILICILVIGILLNFIVQISADNIDKTAETEVETSELETTEEETTTQEETTQEETEITQEETETTQEETETTQEITTAEKTTKEEKTKETTKVQESVETKKTKFIYKDDEKTVTAQLSDKDDLPAGAEFVVSDIKKDDKGYEDAKVLIEQSYADSGYKVENCKLYDMHFEVNGKEVEPAAQVNVTVKYNKAINLNSNSEDKETDIRVVHLNESKKDIQVEDITDKDKISTTTTGKLKETEFVVENFSVISVVSVSEAKTITGIDINEYITNYSLVYYTKEGTAVTIDADTVVPADAKIEIDISYKGLPVKDLLENNHIAIYDKLPNFFKTVTAQGDILSDEQKSVGQLSMDGTNVILTFDESFLIGTSINGKFSVELECDWEKLVITTDPEFYFGYSTVKLKFEDNIVSKYSTVKINKTLWKNQTTNEALIYENGEYYLQYTLTVYAPETGNSEENIPNVKVVDTFTSGNTYVEDYILNEGDEENCQIVDGTLTWTIGSLQRGSTQTLTYKVKLKEKYTNASLTQTLLNNAKVYAGEIEKDDTSSNYTPKAAVTLKKTAVELEKDSDGKSEIIVPQKDGSYLIKYRIEVIAGSTNSYILRNLKIYDQFPSTYKEYVTYNENSFEVIDKITNAEDSTGSKEDLNTIASPNPVIQVSTYDYYNLFIGDLEPGHTKVVTYSVKVSADAMAKLSTTADDGTSYSDLSLTNTAKIYSNPNVDEGNKSLASSSCTVHAAKKVWIRKFSDKQASTKAETIQMTNGSNFSVPEGSYKYTVTVNEAADWNMSKKMKFHDKLSQYMKYVGYVQIDYYNGKYSEDSNLTPVNTIWRNINDKNEFEFTLEDLGIENDVNYSYHLTYYATVDSTDFIGKYVSVNNFDITGNIGLGGTLIPISLNAQFSVSLVGTKSIQVEKTAWYLNDELGTSLGNSSKWIYWKIKITGNIDAGTVIRDYLMCKAIGGTDNHGSDINNPKNMLYGVYQGDLGSANTVKDLESSDKWLKEGKDYTYGYDYGYIGDYKQLYQYVTLDKQIDATESPVYIIFRSSASKYPTKNNQIVKYYNVAGFGSDKNSITDNSPTIYTAVYGKDIRKEIAKNPVYYDGKTDSLLNGLPSNSKSLIKKSGLGIYLYWMITINEQADMVGNATVEDTLPSGLELIDAGINNYGSKYATLTDKPMLSEPYSLQNNILTFKIKNLQKTSNEDGIPDNSENYYCRLYVVTKVVDSDLFMNSGVSKTYKNEAKLTYNEADKGSASADVSLTYETISKKGIYSESNGKYTFIISVNEKGLDFPKIDKITLCDEMGSNLNLITDSLKVYEATNDSQLIDANLLTQGEDWTVRIEEQPDGSHILYLDLPDGKPLKVTYDTNIIGIIGQSYNIINKAYWEGYSPGETAVVDVPNFKYKVSASASIDNYRIKIRKYDNDNSFAALAGATFKIQKVKLNNNKFELDDSVEAIELVTNNNGEALFEQLDRTVVYCYWEDKAPAGYVTDNTKKYFVFVENEDNVSEEQLLKWAELGVQVIQNSSYKEFDVYNSKGALTVNKIIPEGMGNHFDGTYTFGLFTKDAENNYIPVQKQGNNIEGTIEIKEGKQVKGLIFTGLTLDTTYYVFELDDIKKPITSSNNDVTINNKVFYVTSSNTDSSDFSFVTTQDNPKVVIDITNIPVIDSLPSTGGMGTIIFYRTGFLLILCAILLYLFYRKRR